MGETYSMNYAICPYCEHANNPHDTDGLLYDENTTTWECRQCEKEFSVDVYVKYTWTCKEIDK